MKKQALLILLILCLLPASAWAHKVNIFALVDGNTILTESGYSRTKRVHDGVVEVMNVEDHAVLLSGVTDENGKFSFVIPLEAYEYKLDLLLCLNAGEGHQATWLVKYSDYGNTYAAKQPDKQLNKQIEQGTSDTQMTTNEHSVNSAVTDEAVQKMIKEAVHAEVLPLRQMIVEMHDAPPSMQEIIGGIGWILGLFGIFAYMKSRK